MKEQNNLLDTGIKLVKNVNRYNFGRGSISELELLLNQLRTKSIIEKKDKKVIFFIDEFFQSNKILFDILGIRTEDKVLYVSTKIEPKTGYIDDLITLLINEKYEEPCAIISLGGGITLDTAKAVANLLTNNGKAADYQGWDLVKKPGIFKIGIPTISGTGAEATRTCVITNEKSGLKLGMNSDFTVYDHIIMDPDLTKTVPKDQYFYTGMDAYIHCVESLNGSYRNAIGDAFSREAIRLCREVFSSDDMMKDDEREKLMVASYLGGCAIASSYVGVIHPFSAGLSVVLGVHHGLANCITMRAMQEFYPDEYIEFWNLVERQNVTIPKGLCSKLSKSDFMALYQSTIIHEKPLTNALGLNYRNILTLEKVTELFKMM
jgi:3-deoxy-alpha-D-manno-octulosonate 8-oxidase